LDQYGQLDLDQNFTVSGVTTLVDGSCWIEVDGDERPLLGAGTTQRPRTSLFAQRSNGHE